ncbi:alpha/beta hydrolase [Dyadobacter chenwenxiniae]|uniref:Alpha/beta hydrolase n=1 Tax=Dyadobacter chenwenxiniae TaxID=2906456 RepID=A0A9X1TJL5_9BACT|nr:alpha/beta hydrolase [Dyadobacter chenwenxiniae]MCF0060253.1 alpha/beta hydrolase [Dyadobacter chenwenxiniae]UON85991.1 alpha/beta hydrolase [Dyadobacter chenwenxiniae]
MDIYKRNNVTVRGQGVQPMIFAHGFGCGQHMWRHIWPAFEKDYKIVLFDYVGSGGSDNTAYNPERYDSLNGYAQDVLDICNALDLKDCVFVGHSVSCIIGLLASIKDPERFSSLVMVGPSAKYIDEPGYLGGFSKQDIEELLDTMEKNYIGWANFLGPAIMQNDDRPELAEELTESFCSTDPVIARQFAQATFLSDNRTDLANAKHRTLIMQCSNDLIAPVEVGEFIHSQMPGSVYHLMQATGHCPHLSAPDETIEVIQEFLF